MEDAEGTSQTGSYQREFQRSCVQVFKHNFRCGAIEAEEVGSQVGFERSYARVAPTTRQIGKLHGTLVAIKMFTDVLDENMLRKIEEIQTELKVISDQLKLENFSFLAKTTEEIIPEEDDFSGSVPDFDPDDMEMFIGDCENPTANSGHGEEADGTFEMELFLTSLEEKADRLSKSVAQLAKEFGLSLT